ncbi:hypothetical protein SpCBS45565_g05518 [Spizellomyces sp. 'palustris']|nr:hypothetical protein SpCBS45565_g05518 [Spizellomyces sp. 'palustris']
MMIRQGRIGFGVLSTLAIALVLLLPLDLLDCRNPQADVSYQQPVVSLTSTSTRLTMELPITVDSLLQQTLPPAEIRLYVSEDMALKVYSSFNVSKRQTSPLCAREAKILHVLSHPSVRIIPVVDLGPATKYLYVIQEFLSRGGTPSRILSNTHNFAHSSEPDVPVSATYLHQPIVVCDDDHYYAPTFLQDLMRAHHQLGNAAIGLRGWRIRQDLQWGVQGAQEQRRHIIQGWTLAEPYRVGIVTANEGCLIQPRFFVTKAGGVPILNLTVAPPEATLVDDIWMSGHLAAQGVPRIVVPAMSSNVDISQSYTLESQFQSKQTSRYIANSVALRLFSSVWEHSMWYQFGIDSSISPRRVRGWVKVYRWLKGIGLSWKVQLRLSAL